MVARSAPMCLLALIVIGAAGYGLSRVPTGFLPIEDQGYVLAIAQLPDGASLERTKRVMDQVSAIAGKVPGVDSRHFRRFRARQHGDPGQWGCRLYRAQGLERARAGRGPALADYGLQQGLQRH